MSRKGEGDTSSEPALFLFMVVVVVMVGYYFIGSNQAYALDSGNLLQILSKDTAYTIDAVLGSPANVLVLYPRLVGRFDIKLGKGWVFIKDRVVVADNTENRTYVQDASVNVEAAKVWSNLAFAKTYDKVVVGGITDASLLKLTCQKPAPAKKIGEVALIVDPGHGGADKGAVNSADASMQEAERAFALANLLRDKSPFYTMGLTKGAAQQKTIEERLELISAGTDFVLSIHAGSSTTNNYVLAYVPFDSKESATAACYILNELVVKLPEITAAAVIPTGKFGILNKNKGKIAILLELGNMQQPKDSNMLYTKQFEVGQAITEGIKAYYEG